MFIVSTRYLVPVSRLSQLNGNMEFTNYLRNACVVIIVRLDRIGVVTAIFYVNSFLIEVKFRWVFDRFCAELKMRG